jgi:hypothetical protein
LLSRPNVFPFVLSLLILLELFTPTAGQSTGPKVLVQSTWGTPHPDVGNSVALDSKDRVYVAGRTFASSGASDAYLLLLAYNSSGALRWQKTWRNGTGVNEGSGIAVDPSSSNLYVTGVTANTGYDYPHGFLLKLDSSSGLTWQRFWTGGPGSAVVVDSFGNIYVTGWGVFLLKFNSTGNLMWQRTWTSSSEDVSSGISVDSSGNSYVVGYQLNSSNHNVFLVKFDSSGNLIWQKAWGGQGSDTGTGIALDSAGNAYITGTTSSLVAGTGFPFLLKIDLSGSLIWEKVWVGGNYGCCEHVAVDSSGNIYVTGRTEPSGSHRRVLLLRFDPSGSLAWQTTWGADSADNEVGGISVDSAGDAVLTGQTQGPPPYVLESPGNSTVESPSLSLTNASGTVGISSFTVASLQGVTGTPSGSTSYAGAGDEYLTIISNSPTTTTPISNPPWSILGLDPAILFGIVSGVTILVGLSLAAVVVRRRKNGL